MTLLELLELMRKKIALVIILPVVAAAATAGVCWGFMTDDYTASIQMYVISRSNEATNVTSSDMSVSQAIANDVAVLATSSRVKNAAASDVNLPNLKEYEISVDSKTTNRVITLSVKGKQPAKTAQVVNALGSQLSQIAIQVMDVSAVNILDQAQTPEKPSGPNRTLYTAVAFIAGLFVAIAIIVLMDMLNVTVKNAKDLEETSGIPNLGQIPFAKELK